jgi:hypothetical protein
MVGVCTFDHFVKSLSGVEYMGRPDESLPNDAYMLLPASITTQLDGEPASFWQRTTNGDFSLPRP